MLATLGRTAYRRRRLILWAWLVLVLVLAGFVIGSGVFSHLMDSDGVSTAESVHGAKILHDGSEEGRAFSWWSATPGCTTRWFGLPCRPWPGGSNGSRSSAT